MKAGHILRHIAVIAAGVFLLAGMPLIASGYFLRVMKGADAVSSATVKIDEPSGEFVIFINAAMHRDEKKLAKWKTFFAGGDISYIFEDIVCSVAGGDAAGLEAARSFMSRLPENQMKIKTEDPLLLISRADRGLYDIIILSREFADAYDAYTAGASGGVMIEKSAE